MEKDDEYLHTFFNHIAQLSFDKAKEHVEKEKEVNRTGQLAHWSILLVHLQQLSLAEKSYVDIGFLQNKNKSFLRKDNSLKSVYETMKVDLKRLEENCKQTVQEKSIANYCQNIAQFLNARINLIDFYEKVYTMGTNKQLKYNDLLIHIENIIQKHILGFTDISLTPIKATFSLECEILEQLFKALTELQRLQFLPSLALIHGAHTRLSAWESKMQNRETWKLGFLKNNPLPALFQWLQKLKGAVLSKFSLYFRDTLAQQTTPSDMKQQCSKLLYDHYQKMVSFQRKYEALSVLLLSGSQVSCDTTSYQNFPVIVSYPEKIPSQLEIILKMISDTATELLNVDRVIYKFSSQDQCTYILTTVEINIYLVIIFGSKKSEKDIYVGNFISELCTNLRCSKIFVSLKNSSK